MSVRLELPLLLKGGVIRIGKCGERSTDLLLDLLRSALHMHPGLLRQQYLSLCVVHLPRHSR